MASNPVKKQPIYLRRENDKGIVQGWAVSNMEIDQMAGEVRFSPRGLLAGKWGITLRPAQVTAFQIEMISDISTLGMMYGGGLLGYGIAAFMSRWVKMPALKFEQGDAPMGERQMTIRAVGWQPRKKTREIANTLAAMLTERGAKVLMPNLADDEAWKYPIVPVLIGVGILILIVVVLCVVVALLSSGSGSGS